MSKLKVKQRWTISLADSIHKNMKSNRPRKSNCTRSLSIYIYVYIGLCDRRQSSKVISIVNKMTFILKYTRNYYIYYRIHALLTVYFRLIVIWIYVLVCYKSNMRIWAQLVNMNLTVNTPFIIYVLMCYKHDRSARTLISRRQCLTNGITF